MDQDNKPEKQYVKLSAAGMRQYQDLQLQFVKIWGFWTLVGSFCGIVTSRMVQSLPLNKPKNTLQKYGNRVFGIFALCFTYHGYKVANLEYRKMTRRIQQDEKNILKENE